MAKQTITTLLALFVTSLINTVTGYYCDSDRCLEDEFCCGENICCVSYKVWELWYFWCGILFCLFLLSMCACFWRERSQVYWIFRAPAAYSPLSPGGETTYSSSRGEPYMTASERSVTGSSYYSPTQKPPSWYSTNTRTIDDPPAYSDTDESYNTGTNKSSVY